MRFETIRYEVADHVATITLDRPDVLNAVNAKMHEELRAALDAAAGEDAARALILTGAGRGFCAGQDLGDRDPDGGDIDLQDAKPFVEFPDVRAEFEAQAAYFLAHLLSQAA